MNTQYPKPGEEIQARWGRDVVDDLRTLDKITKGASPSAAAAAARRSGRLYDGPFAARAGYDAASTNPTIKIYRGILDVGTTWYRWPRLADQPLTGAAADEDEMILSEVPDNYYLVTMWVMVNPSTGGLTVGMDNYIPSLRLLTARARSVVKGIDPGGSGARGVDVVLASFRFYEQQVLGLNQEQFGDFRVQVIKTKPPPPPDTNPPTPPYKPKYYCSNVTDLADNDYQPSVVSGTPTTGDNPP